MPLKGVQMSSNDLELEEGLKDVGNKLASPPSDLQQLLLLLDNVQNLLSRVEQCPSASMLTALRPAMKKLVAKGLLGHSDMDVKVAIASCLSEITRIKAPDVPYNDDIMKEIFGLIVEAFNKLDDMSSRSFPKRVSILETVVKVRSCVLMLDLDCNDLILKMFQHFLKTIRSKHSDTVFSSMESIMTLLLEEAESISPRLLSCLLDRVKVAEKNIQPTAKKLAENVLVNCSLKLRPYLADIFNGNGALLSDYSKVVAAVFQGNLDTLINNEMNASGENKAADHKLSERTLSDDFPQGSALQEGEIFHPEKAVAAADRFSKSAMSNGNGDSTASKRKNKFLHHCGESSVNTKDILDSGEAMPHSGKEMSSSLVLAKCTQSDREENISLQKKEELATISPIMLDARLSPPPSAPPLTPQDDLKEKIKSLSETFEEEMRERERAVNLVNNELIRLSSEVEILKLQRISTPADRFYEGGDLVLRYFTKKGWLPEEAGTDPFLAVFRKG